MKMSMRNQNWRLGMDILVLLVLLLATKECSGQRNIRQLADAIRLRLPQQVEGTFLFAQPGTACDEEEALRVGNFLYATTRNFELAKEEKLRVLAKDICDFKVAPGSSEVEDITCLDFKCQCFHPAKDWNPHPKPSLENGFGKCRNRYGESCVDGDDCAYNQICSDLKGPPKIVRLSEYKWQTNRKCKEDCIRTACEATNKEKCLHPGFKASKCKAVTDCLQDPFQVVFHCIAKCHKCEGSANAIAAEHCQQDCRKEVQNYARAAINRVCHLTCRSDPDSKGCFEKCEIENKHLLKARIVEACPFSVPYEKCVACVSDKVRFNTAAIAILKDECTKKCKEKGTDREPCRQPCIDDCVVQKDRETFFGCQASCKDDKIDPLCARNCHNTALSSTSKTIQNECKKECDKTASPCDLCIDNCRESRILEYQLGTMKASVDPNCNVACSKASRYTCTACARHNNNYYKQCKSQCEYARTASDCSATCTTICKQLEITIVESMCYKKCLQDSKPLCFFDCISKGKQQTDACEEECSLAKIVSSWKGECTVCSDVCLRDIVKLNSVYCDPLVCASQPDCEKCEEVVLQDCFGNCTVGLDQEDSVRCHERCLDVCDSTRRFFYERNHFNILSCETYCEIGSGIKCMAGCESYCEATKAYRCECTADRKNFMAFVKLPYLDPKDKCISCRRRFRLRGRTECRKRLCAVPVGADESGVICLQHCIIQAYRQLIIETQSRAIEFCNFSGDRVCEDNRIKQTVEQDGGQIIRKFSFQRCLNTGLNRGFINLCLDKECDRICERAVEYEADLACGIKDGDCVEMESSRKDQVILPPEPCRNCSIRVAVEYLAACRKQCSLPPDLIVSKLTASQAERRSLICKTGCLQACFTEKFHLIYIGCVKEYVTKGGSLTLTEYLKGCTSDYKEYIYNECVTKKCGTDDFSGGLNHDCPICTDFCDNPIHTAYFIRVAVGIMCKDCTKPDFKPPDICEMCKHTLIKESRCSLECIPASLDEEKCQKHCKFYCGRVQCLQRENRYNRFNAVEINACAGRVIDPQTRSALKDACEANCKVNCESTCYGYCIQNYRLQGYCDMDCNPRLAGVQTAVNNIQPMFRQSRKDPRGPVRPTRRPGPGKFEQQWCCFSNGFGQCNAPRPGKESQHESQAIRTSIWKYFLIIQLLSLALIL